MQAVDSHAFCITAAGVLIVEQLSKLDLRLRRAVNPMLPNRFTVFLTVLIEAWSARLDTQIQFLNFQIKLLRQKALDLRGIKIALHRAILAFHGFRRVEQHSS